MVKSQWQKRLNNIDILLRDIPYVIAGGFPRDIHFGAEPRDIDVWVQYTPTVANDITETLQRLEVSFTAMDCQKIAEGYGDTGDLEMEQLFKIKDIDIIIVDRPIKDICEHFDYNLNQFVWSSGLPVYVGDSDLDYLTNIKPLDDIPHMRQDKILRKFRLLVEGDDCSIEDVSEETPDKGLDAFLSQN